MAEAKITNGDELVAWLEGKPREWGQVIGMRAALRVLPLVSAAFASTHLTEKTTLDLTTHVFRATFISWAALVYPTQDMTSTAAAASAAAVSDFDDVAAAAFASSVAASASSALEFSFSSAADAATAAVSAAAGVSSSAAAPVAAAFAFAAGASAIGASTATSMEPYSPADDAADEAWQSLSVDANWLEDSVGKPADQAQALSITGIWEGAAPIWVMSAWKSLVKELLNSDANWGHFCDWYDRRLQGTRHGFSVAESNVAALDIRIATQPHAWWRRGAAAVNRDIANWVEAARAGGQATQEVNVGDPVEIAQDGQPNAPTTPRAANARSSTRPKAKSLKSVPPKPKATPSAPGMPARGEPDSNPARPPKRAELEPLPDDVDGSVDHLARADVAYALAGRINTVWDQMNMPPDAPRHPFDSAWWTGRFKHKSRPSSPGFVVHVDAPWGGGKSTFAEFVALILNPYAAGNPLPAWLRALPMGRDGTWPERFRRPWHVVRFNAWRHQHVAPPWWVFYETIRQSCGKAALRDEGAEADPWLPLPDKRFAFRSPMIRLFDVAELTASEYSWRFFSKALLYSLAPLVLTAGAIFVLYRLGLLKTDGTLAESTTGGAAIVLSVLLGGGASVWKLWSSFTQTLLPGTPDAAKNFSQGADDPLRRMRAHFVRLMERVHRPVLVIVDDLDRCEPAFVVELVRGMQTILASPRVVYLLLGDRDWIEQSFSEVHKAMRGIEVGPEHRFGGRFVEKAIQFSMVLPEVKNADRAAYVRNLLTLGGAAPKPQPVTEPPVILDAIAVPKAQRKAVERVRSALTEALKTPDYETRETLAREVSTSKDFKRLSIPKQAFEQEMAQKLFYQAATDSTAEKGTAHMLESLSPALPANPRQIKRIINTLSLLGQVLRIQDPKKRPGSPDWEILARWVVLMVEWPKSWFTLTRHPGLADMALAIKKADDDAKKAGAATAKTQMAKKKSNEETLDKLERGHVSAGLLPPGGGRLFAKAIAANPDVMNILDFHESDWRRQELKADKILWLREVMPAASGQMLDAGKAETVAKPEP